MNSIIDINNKLTLNKNIIYIKLHIIKVFL